MINKSLDEDDNSSLLRLIHSNNVKIILNPVLIGTSEVKEFLNVSDVDPKKAIRLAQ